MIKSERLELIIEFLTSQMNHWLFFPIVMTVLGMSVLITKNPDMGRPDFLMWALCGLFPIVFFVVRRYSERLWLFFLCHAAIAAVSLILPVFGGFASRLVCVVSAVAYMVYSLTLRLRENGNPYSSAINPLAALGVCAAANFLLHRQEGVPDWDSYYFFTLIGIFACYLIIYYLKHYLKFLQVNKSSAGYLPAREILRSGMGFVLPYTLFGALILSLSLNVKWLEPILNVLKAGIKAVLRFLFGLFPRQDTQDLLQPSDAGAAAETDWMDLPLAKPFWLWEVLEPVVYVFFFSVCAVGIVKLTVWAAKLILDRFGKRSAKYDFLLLDETTSDFREKCGIAKKDSSGRKTGLFHRFTAVERIRRLYKKRVLSDMEVKERESLNYMTAAECGKKLSLPGMAGLYDKARYSDREITAADVREMKLACGGKKDPLLSDN